jgi:integral membrane protein (TIGR01906 family)
VRRDYRVLRTATRIALALCAPVLLLLSNLYLLATPAFIRYEYGRPSFPPADRYSAPERLSLAEATLHYIRSSEGADYLTTLQSQGRPVYNTREVRHLVDAKLVMRGALWVHAASALICLVALILSRRSRDEWHGALRAVFLGCLALVASLIIIGILAYTNFVLFFTIFHRLLFEGDTWLFSFSDTLIQLFPVQFWMDATWLLSLWTVGECAVVGAAAYALSRRLRSGR